MIPNITMMPTLYYGQLSDLLQLIDQITFRTVLTTTQNLEIRYHRILIESSG